MWTPLVRYTVIGVSSASVLWTATDIAGITIKQVTGRSMQPTLNPDYYTTGKPKLFSALDWVLLMKCDGSDVRKGDIVTIYNPLTPIDQDIKRVVATEDMLVGTRSYKNRKVVVPEGYLWLEGDNHAISKDSNSYGPIPRSLVFGKAVVVVFPPWRWQTLKSEVPQPSLSKVNASETEEAVPAEFGDD